MLWFERKYYFAVLDGPPPLSTAVNRVAYSAAVDYLSTFSPYAGSGQGVGSAGRRSDKQKAAARKLARDFVATIGPRSLVAYTDGASTGNPGPAGAGMHITSTNGDDWQEEAIAALGKSTNNVGELWGIGMAAQAAELRIRACPHAYTHLYILTDSQYSIGCLTRGWKSKTNAELVQAVKRIIALIPPYITVIVQWVPAHVGIDSNEHADFLAGEGAKFSASGRTNVNMVAGVQNNLFLPRLPPHANA